LQESLRAAEISQKTSTEVIICETLWVSVCVVYYDQEEYKTSYMK
jgi:hypothetical protein